MLRVLLLVEDYGEMVFLQILLNKLGFDVGTLKNPKALNDGIIKLNADVVVMTAKGRRINGSELAASVKKINGRPKIVLMAPAAQRDRLTKTEIQFAEAVIESPANPPTFIETISRLGNLDAEPLLEKYKKMKPQLDEKQAEASQFVTSSTPAEETVSIHVSSSGPRQERYAKFLQLDQPPAQNAFSKQKISEVVKELRRDETPDENQAERIAFIKALFQKKA